MEKLGVDQIEKAMNLIVEGGNVAAAVIADKGPLISKLSHLTALYDEFVGLVGFSPSVALAQAKDLDSVEKADLFTKLKVKFDLADDQVEAKIEAAIELAVEVESLIEKVVAFAASLKSAPPVA
jgi:hypothetical protein